MNRHYAGVAERAGHRCEYCHAPEAIFNLPFEVEHIVPKSQDGPDDESNQALACRACNLYKSDQQSGIDQPTQEVVRLFHPRRDRWDEHFRTYPATNNENVPFGPAVPVGPAIKEGRDNGTTEAY